MFWLDYLIVAFMALGALMGAASGLFRQVARVVCLVAAVYAAILLNDKAAIGLREMVWQGGDVGLCRGLAYVLVFLIVYVVLFCLAHFLDHGIRVVQLGAINRLLGACLGLAKMALLVAVLCQALTHLPPQTRPWLDKSTLASPFAAGMEWLVTGIPPKYKTELADSWKSLQDRIENWHREGGGSKK